MRLKTKLYLITSLFTLYLLFTRLMPVTSLYYFSYDTFRIQQSRIKKKKLSVRKCPTRLKELYNRCILYMLIGLQLGINNVKRRAVYYLKLKSLVGMRPKKVTMGARMELLDLARHLRQEHLFVTAERQQLQNLNEKVLNAVEHLYHVAWIARQQRVNLDNLILSRPDAHPAACCQQASALENVNFIDSYRVLAGHDNAYAEFLQQFREDPKLIATCLMTGEKQGVDTIQSMVGIVMSAIYGSCILPEDEIFVLKLLRELMVLQLATSENPRRLLRRGSCAFSQVYKTFNEGLFSAKLFLTAALHTPIMHLLMEDDLFLDIDPGKAVVRFPPHERLRHFGKEGTPEYKANLLKYRQWTINKLVNLTNRFIEGIHNNMYCFPQSLSWLVRQMYTLIMNGKRVEVREVGAMCADLVFVFFICPAIVNPEPYGITDAPISFIARFNLMQVAQILQVLAMSKWEEIDPKLMDLYGKFEKDCMSTLLDLILEGSSDDSPSDLVSQLHDLTRSAVLITEQELASLIAFLRCIESETEEEFLKKTLGTLLSSLPQMMPSSNSSLSQSKVHSSSTSTPPTSKRNLLGKVAVPKKNSKVGPLSTTSQDVVVDDSTSSVVENDLNTLELPQPDDVLVISFSTLEWDCPGMLSEEKVLRLEQQKKQNRVRMNLDSLTGEEAYSVASGPEKRTRFSLSQDQESIGTSDNLEAISEAASNHSVSSSLDLENENENDNLSDMVSANVSGRDTPNVSGRDTPSSQVEEEPRQQPLNLPITTRKQNQEDIEDKFCKFEIMPMIEGDETKSMVSDTWSTDVLASDSETVEQSDVSSQVTLESQPLGILDTSETASQSDAWSMDVLASDTERLLELDTDDTASVARSDDTARSEIENESSSGVDVPRLDPRDVDDSETYADRVLKDPSQPTSSALFPPRVHVTVLSGDQQHTSVGFQPVIEDAAEPNCLRHPSSTTLHVRNQTRSSKMFDPLSVDVTTQQNDVIVNNGIYDDLTPTGNFSTNYFSSKEGDITPDGILQDNMASMQSLGRLSFAVKKLPDEGDYNRGSSLLDSLQETSSTSISQSSGTQRQRSSIVELLSQDLTKTLNIPSDTSEESLVGSPSRNSLIEFEREILGMNVEEKNNEVSAREHPRSEVSSHHNPSLVEQSQKGMRRRTKDAQRIIDEVSCRLSSASSSSGSSTGSTDITVKGTVTTNGPIPLAESKMESDHPTLKIHSDQKRTSSSSTTAYTGAIPKSISFDKTAERRYREGINGEDRDKHRKSFFKLSSFKFTFKPKNRKQRPGEQHETTCHSSGNSDVGLTESKERTTYRQLQRAYSEEVRPSYQETSDEILAKYRKNPISSHLEVGQSQQAVQEREGMPADEEPTVFDSSNLEASFIFNDAKRKLRIVLGSADIQTLPWLSTWPGHNFPLVDMSENSRSQENELVPFLKVLLAEAINLHQRPLVAHLHEALRCVHMFDNNGCQKLFRSLKEDYRRRAPYIAYLVRCRQGLLSTLAHLDALTSRIVRDKHVCTKYLIAMCVRTFLEKNDRNIQLFVRKFQALTVSDEKAQLVEKFLQYLYSSMETDPMWQTASNIQNDHARKVVERTIMSQIYVHALYPNGDGDVLRDQVLHQHMLKLSQVITPNHKDLKVSKVYHHECPWPSAQAELITINAYKTPRDKIQCVLRCCNTIMNLLSMAGDQSVPAADDFMPVLVYVMIKANPTSLLSTVQYVNTFYEKQLEGEEAYWWTQFCSAVEFIKTMDY
ncbi:GTPase activating protein and VPS9 domains 1 isoform X3 [Tachypleus tridentatus]|uniref:GTPase activating protein and VPS9 domains 1 isoform X3 n=1 Tax=Tachypleus tridentatus TaxID=6853 RepID=UPI003FD0B441